MNFTLPKIMLLLLLFQGCRAQKEILANLEAKKNVVLGEWISSREENLTTENSETMVWRRNSFDFPLSRFRKKYTFLEEGKLTYTTPGADDRPVTLSGTWKITSKSNNYFLIIEEESGVSTSEIVTLGEEKLVLRKQKQ